MRHATLLALMGVTLAAPGCRLLSRPARTKPIDGKGAYWMEYDATRRGALLLPAGEGGKAATRILAEPSPDAALSATLDIAAKTKSGEVSVKLAESIVELGKRTEAVMVLRESLYRLGELVHNGALKEGDAKALFEKILVEVGKIATAEKEEAVTKGEDAKARLKQAEAEAEQFRLMSQIYGQADEAGRARILRHGFPSRPSTPPPQK